MTASVASIPRAFHAQADRARVVHQHVQRTRASARLRAVEAGGKTFHGRWIGQVELQHLDLRARARSRASRPHLLRRRLAPRLGAACQHDIATLFGGQLAGDGPADAGGSARDDREPTMERQGGIICGKLRSILGSKREQASAEEHRCTAADGRQRASSSEAGREHWWVLEAPVKVRPKDCHFWKQM